MTPAGSRWRCKRRKPNGEIIDGCGWEGSNDQVERCPNCGSDILRLTWYLKTPIEPEPAPRQHMGPTQGGWLCGHLDCWCYQDPEIRRLIDAGIKPGPREAVIFWAGHGWKWHDGNAEHGPHDDMDGAITAAKALGFRIKDVQRTRGLLSAGKVG